jgi:hypothetical protein
MIELPAPVTNSFDTLRSMQRRYAQDEHRPLAGYATLMTLYLGATAGLMAVARGREEAAKITTRDLVLITVATHRLARTMTKDAITSPLRAPFTQYAGPGGPGELHEEVADWAHGHPIAHAVGELVTCPFCLAQWIADNAHRRARAGADGGPAGDDRADCRGGADALQYVYAGLQSIEIRGVDQRDD